MRLRQLGTTQSIIFVAPPEVDQSIRSFCRKEELFNTINSTDVVTWLLEQTCRGNEQMRLLYQAQGIDFCRRSNAALLFPNRLDRPESAKPYLDTVFLPEHQSLAELYSSGNGSSAHEDDEGLASRTEMDYLSPLLEKFATVIRNQKAAVKATDGAAIYGSALEEVELQREVEFQVEEVRHSQSPPAYKAHRFPGLHEQIKAFALEGKLDVTAQNGFEKAFNMVMKTPIGRKFRLSTKTSKLYISTEWRRTIVRSSGSLEGMLVCPAAHPALLL